MKKTFYSELAYVMGIVILALGTAMMERANFGMSMVVAPAYLLHLKVSQTLTFFSFGMAEYMFQGVLLIAMMLLLKRFRTAYLFSFITAIFYGFTLDIMLSVMENITCNGFAARGTFYILGMIVCAVGVSLLFHTYIPLEAYEMFVKEVSAKLGMDINKFKTIYDCTSCACAVIMSFAFFGFGRFEGVKLGTVICAFINGKLIGLCSTWFDSTFEFKDGLKLRGFFEHQNQS
ncbi:MAG: hypothetical protein IKU32_07875 [Clostridia bacterium]|nr:hypothetical protein [Clostridia bacterium]